MKDIDIDKLANYARLDIGEDEKKARIKDFESIIPYINQIREVESLSSVLDAPKDRNILREDEVTCFSEYREALINSFPDKEGGYLKVPKVL